MSRKEIWLFGLTDLSIAALYVLISLSNGENRPDIQRLNALKQLNTQSASAMADILIHNPAAVFPIISSDVMHDPACSPSSVQIEAMANIQGSSRVLFEAYKSPNDDSETISSSLEIAHIHGIDNYFGQNTLIKGKDNYEKLSLLFALGHDGKKFTKDITSVDIDISCGVKKKINDPVLFEKLVQASQGLINISDETEVTMMKIIHVKKTPEGEEDINSYCFILPWYIGENPLESFLYVENTDDTQKDQSVSAQSIIRTRRITISKEMFDDVERVYAESGQGEEIVVARNQN